MSNQIKLRSTQPNNTIRGGISGVPVDYVYQNTSNISVPLGDVMYSNDQTISLNSFANGTTAIVKIAPSYRILKQAILRVQLAAPITINDHNVSPETYIPNAYTKDYKLHQHVELFSYRLNGAEKINIEPWCAIQEIINQLDSEEKKEAYRLQNGRYLTTYKAGEYLHMILPLPSADCTSDVDMKCKPFPLHLLGQSLEVQFKFGNSLSLSNAEVELVYGDFPYTDLFRNGAVRYLTRIPYGFKYDIPAISTQGTKRTIRLSGLRPGETSEFYFHFAPNKAITSDLPISGETAAYTFPKYWSLPVDLVDQDKCCLGLRCSDIQIRFQNQVIWSYNRKSYDVYDLSRSKVSSKFSKIYGYRSLRTVIGAGPAGIHPLHAGSNRVNAVNVSAVPIASHYEYILNKDPLTGEIKGYSTAENQPESQSSFFYKLPMSEVLDELSKNKYFVGVDTQNADIFLDFVVDSDASDAIEVSTHSLARVAGSKTIEYVDRSDGTTIATGVTGLAISPKHALDICSGHVYLTQKVITIYQVLGANCSQIQ